MGVLPASKFPGTSGPAGRACRQAWAIASTTARELVRNPAYAGLTGLAAAVIATAPFFALFHLGEQVKLVADLGLGTALVAGLLVGTLGASWAVSEEIESLSALAVLAKPVSRGAFLLGKYLGVLLAASLATAALGVVLVLTLRALADDARVVFAACGAAACLLAGGGAFVMRRLGCSWRAAVARALAISLAALLAVLDSHGVLRLLGREVSGWSWEVFIAVAGALLQVAVLSAVAVALSTRLPLAANMAVVLAVFVLGQVAPGEGGLAAFLLPDLPAFQFADAVVEGLETGRPERAYPAALAGAALVAAGYVTGALLAGAALFKNRDIQ